MSYLPKRISTTVLVSEKALSEVFGGFDSLLDRLERSRFMPKVVITSSKYAVQDIPQLASDRERCVYQGKGVLGPRQFLKLLDDGVTYFLCYKREAHGSRVFVAHVVRDRIQLGFTWPERRNWYVPFSRHSWSKMAKENGKRYRSDLTSPPPPFEISYIFMEVSLEEFKEALSKQMREVRLGSGVATYVACRLYRLPYTFDSEEFKSLDELNRRMGLLPARAAA